MNDDILRHICDHLPPNSLKNASTVHRVFFERWLRQRYRRIDITSADKNSKRLWAHLKENKWIADSVTCVHIRPWLVKPRTQTYQSRTENALNTVAMIFNPDYIQSKAKKKVDKRLETDIGQIKSVFAALKNVRDYHIEWDQNPNYHTKMFQEFLKSAFTNWSGALTSLSIHIPVDMLNSFVTATLPQLEHIHICLSSGKMSHTQINIHLDGFSVFLHNLKDSLTSMSIESTPDSENLTLSRFYHYLGTFPHLRAISLTIPFDGGQLPDPHTFSRFVRKHTRTLEALSLKTTRCAVHSERVAPECINWVQIIIGSIQVPLPELKHVTIALRPLKAPLDIISDFLRIHAFTLQSVALMDRKLELDVLLRHVLVPLAIANPFNLASLPLRTLGIRIESLSSNLLVMLARRLPGLQTLKVGLSVRPPDSEYALRQYFNHNLGAQGFNGTNWDLERLEIVSPGTSWRDSDGTSWIAALEKVLVDHIPSLQSVEGVQSVA